MFKKVALSVIILAGLVCFACLFGVQKADKSVVIQFASWGSESEVKILEPILKDFERQHAGVRVDFMHIPQNYFQKIHLLFASNTAPDVIFMNNQYLPLYAQAGVLEDLSKYDFDYDKYYPQALKVLSYDGKIYAVARDVSTLLIYYNKSLFDKYGVSYPKSGWTLDEFLAAAVKLTHNPKVFGISFEEEPLFFLPYLNLYGGWTQRDVDNYFSEDVLKNENIRRGLNFYADLRLKYRVAPLKEDVGSATMAQLFLQQKLGMHLSGRWLVPKYREEADFDWDVVEFPSLDKKTRSNVPLDASGWAISKSGTHKKEAVALVKFLSSKLSSEKFTKSGLIVPARMDVANSSVFLDGEKPANSKAFLTVSQNSAPTPYSAKYKQIMDSLKIKTEYIFNKR